MHTQAADTTTARRDSRAPHAHRPKKTTRVRHHCGKKSLSSLESSSMRGYADLGVLFGGVQQQVCSPCLIPVLDCLRLVRERGGTGKAKAQLQHTQGSLQTSRGVGTLERIGTGAVSTRRASWHASWEGPQCWGCLTCALCGGSEAHRRFTKGHTPAPTHSRGTYELATEVKPSLPQKGSGQGLASYK